jgi:molybdopterin converting factor small subunit
MPTVFIPGSMRELTGGQAETQVAGSTVREVISALDESHPGVKDWLVENNRLKPNISVAVDGVVSPMGLLQDVEQDSEIHFVAAIAGGGG